jgi:hypothetical protein
MNVQAAADQLLAALNWPPWLVAVGVGKLDGGDCIYIYTKGSPKQKDLAFLDKGWEGFPVVVKKSGQFSPLTA